MRSVHTAALLAGALLTGAASADIIQFTSDNALSTEALGSYEGSLDYDPSQARLTVTITNTSPAANGGFITGLAFRVDSTDPAAMAVLSTSSVPFSNIVNASAAPFGTYVGGAALGGDWLGGGSPQAGVGVGETATLVFSVTASDSATLTAIDFIEVSSAAGPDFVVRFRGFADGGSDKVPGRPDEVVPSPGTLGVLGGLGILARRRRR
jgi:hypothetical protein